MKHPSIEGALDWQHRTDAALAWLHRSIEATGGQGSSHSWSPVFGWAKAYPETTGYLIETLLDYADLKQDESLRDLAFQCSNWLISIQLPSGAFASLLAGGKKPSVFNTAMILFGLARVNPTPDLPTEVRDRLFPEGRGDVERSVENTKGVTVYSTSPLPSGKSLSRTSVGRSGVGLTRAVSWLLSVLEPDFSWRKHAYVPGFTPTYYTRAVWGVLKANQILQNADSENAMRGALHFYAQRFLPNGVVHDWGFWPGKPAFTHTMAYTLEGFLESAVLLGEKEILQKTIETGEQFLEVRRQAGNRTAGRYGEQWRGDYSFLCVTGNCQLSVFFHRLWELTGEEKFHEAADSFLAEILDFQYVGKNKNRYGALPGSAPIWKSYLRFRYPNWGVKFFLDAMRLAHFRLEKP